MTRRRALRPVLGVLLVAGACTGRSPAPVASGSRSPSADASSTLPATSPSPVVDPLCKPPPREAPGPKRGGALPPAIAKIADQVEQVRGLSFKRPLSPEPLTHVQLAKKVKDSYESQYPKEQAAAGGRALITMGALPAGTDLYKAVVDLQTNQVLGFYNTETHKLVFQSNKAFSPLARFTLSHELTHALQDQNFGLGRLDRLSRACRADRAEAFRDLVEGDAVLSQIQWARLNLSSQEQAQLQQELSSFPPPPASVPQFVKADFAFPYDAGPTFVQALLARGGLRALNDALRSPPASTEQILHPDKYPKDRPQVVVVPDVSSKLGKGWKAIDFADVGEGFLLDMLQLDVPTTDARPAAAGWDGGQYRAFGKDSQTAVLLMTVWDTPRDAREFAATMQRWVATRPAKVLRAGSSVSVLFGSDKATLRVLATAAA